MLRCSRLALALPPLAWQSPSRSSSGCYPLHAARFICILYGRSRLQMCASCFVLMHQLDGTIRSGRGAARTRQEAAHLGWYGARRFFIQHPFIQRFIQAVDPSTADTPCPAPTVELYSLYSTIQHVTALQPIQLYSALQSTASTADLWSHYGVWHKKWAEVGRSGPKWAGVQRRTSVYRVA